MSVKKCYYCSLLQGSAVLATPSVTLTCRAGGAALTSRRTTPTSSRGLSLSRTTGTGRTSSEIRRRVSTRKNYSSLQVSENYLLSVDYVQCYSSQGSESEGQQRERCDPHGQPRQDQQELRQPRHRVRQRRLQRAEHWDGALGGGV